MYKDYRDPENEVTENDAIKNSIKNILLTPRGSLPGKPYFGSDLYKVLFSQIDHITVSIIKQFTREALTAFEDRIAIVDINVKQVEEYNKIIINLVYDYTDKRFEKTRDSTSISVNL